MSDNIQQIAEKIRPALKRGGVLRSSIFGSVARGEDSPNSDTDILVELPPGKTLLDLVGIKIELEKELGRNVDVLTYNSLSPRLKERIEKEQVKIL